VAILLITGLSASGMSVLTDSEAVERDFAGMERDFAGKQGSKHARGARVRIGYGDDDATPHLGPPP